MIEEKYIKLLLKGCLKVSEDTPLFINYDKINKHFVKKVVKYAKKLGLTDIYLKEKDIFYEHDLLQSMSCDDISKSKIFDSSDWDIYAKKDAAFLLLETEIPNLMNDIDSEKISKASYVRQTTKPIYKKKQLNSLIPWCIAAVPNEHWAKELFPNSSRPLEEFWDTLADICMLESDNPIASWNKHLKKQATIANTLNDLKIKKIYIKNNLGTNLELELPNNSLWQSASSGKWIVNMPSYELFTTPNYKKTNGIVYSSKPLVYNGKLIDKFYLKFEKGKVIDFDAKEGKDILDEIIKTDELSSYLGEFALVNYNSPISNTNMVFKSTIFDENASCHLALGSGFLECLNNAENYNAQELDKIGINSSKNHVDFMIGTNDLTVEAETKNGLVTIMENGNLVI